MHWGRLQHVVTAMRMLTRFACACRARTRQMHGWPVRMRRRTQGGCCPWLCSALSFPPAWQLLVSTSCLMPPPSAYCTGLLHAAMGTLLRAGFVPAGDEALYQYQRPLPLGELYSDGGSHGLLGLLKSALWQVQFCMPALHINLLTHQWRVCVNLLRDSPQKDRCCVVR